MLEKGEVTQHTSLCFNTQRHRGPLLHVYALVKECFISISREVTRFYGQYKNKYSSSTHYFMWCKTQLCKLFCILNNKPKCPTTGTQNRDTRQWTFKGIGSPTSSALPANWRAYKEVMLSGQENASHTQHIHVVQTSCVRGTTNKDQDFHRELN